MILDELLELLRDITPAAGPLPQWYGALDEARIARDLAVFRRWLEERRDLLRRQTLQHRLEHISEQLGNGVRMLRLVQRCAQVLASPVALEALSTWEQTLEQLEQEVDDFTMADSLLRLLRDVSAYQPAEGDSENRASSALLPEGQKEPARLPPELVGPEGIQSAEAVEGSVSDPSGITIADDPAAELDGAEEEDATGGRPNRLAPPSSRWTESRLRGRIAEVLSELRNEKRPEGGLWGLDFGTARSKLSFRPDDGTIAENAETNNMWSSVVATERRGGRILFGDEAAQMTAATAGWYVHSSMKRYLVGKRLDPNDYDSRLTTELLVTLYMAWMCHRTRELAPDSPSPLQGRVQVSLPLVSDAEEPSLRSLFSSQYARKLHYREWLPQAFRVGQLTARIFEGEPLPADLNVLRNVILLWGQKEWNEIYSGIELTSEPAAVIGDYDPELLPDGLTMLVDCGAGTTDVSIFHKTSEGLRTVVELASIVGGDQIDEAMTRRILADDPALSEYRQGIRGWCREAKNQLLAQGAVKFDPEELELPSAGVPSTIRLSDIQDGLDELKTGVWDVVRSAIQKAERVLLYSKPRHAASWPDGSRFSAVWFLGGASQSTVVPEAIYSALQGRLGDGEPRALPVPSSYETWTAARYRLMAVALGASRRNLQYPEPLQPERDIRTIGNHPFDRD